MKTGLPQIDLDICTGCGDCVVWCPNSAVKVVNGKVVMVSPENCNYCTDCEVVCPVGAISCPFEIILSTARTKAASRSNRR